VAIPAITYGIETVSLSETTIEALEVEQARWAKETLRLPSSTPNVVAQLMFGLPSFREVIYACKLSYFKRLTELPPARYAAQALKEHESGGWSSPYLHDMAKIQVETNMLQLPATTDFVKEGVSGFGMDKLNERLTKYKNIMIKEVDTRQRLRSTKEGAAWGWINRAIMGSTMIQYSGVTGEWERRCSVDNSINSDLHCVSSCSATRDVRVKTGMSMFFTSCNVKDISDEVGYYNFVMGLDNDGSRITDKDYQERGNVLKEIFQSVE
jgi:hypothetical protein